MKPKAWRVGAAIAVLVLLTVGIEVQQAQADGPYHFTNCRHQCAPLLHVNDGKNGFYICQHTGTCTEGEVGQSCNYQPLEQCFYQPYPF